MSYAQFEGSDIGKGANEHLKNEWLKEERVLLLDAWHVFEKAKGDSHSIYEVEARMPRCIKRRRVSTDENGAEIGWEEYFDCKFPEQEGSASNNLKILEMAAKWKQIQ
jgi:crooked neck